jgi:hypothetical protein
LGQLAREEKRNQSVEMRQLRTVEGSSTLNSLRRTKNVRMQLLRKKIDENKQNWMQRVDNWKETERDCAV